MKRSSKKKEQQRRSKPEKPRSRDNRVRVLQNIKSLREYVPK